ncbi:MAG TPA: hypothetical protein VMT31_08320 [Methanomicrobiales archaeon]|jgi:hypothetical protein|nr:hypothetical protein [Methanomicrobiales archaeon]
MDEVLIKKAFDESGIRNELPCAKAFQIAEKYGIPKMDIAKYCNRHKVKIRKCQLGCFG